MDRECGGGERNFHISRPGERLRPRAINGRGRGSTRWPSAGLRPPAAPAAPDPRANSWVSLPSLLQAQPASQLPLPLRAPGVARLPSVHPSTPSPSSSRWMMLSMLSLSISAIAFPPPTLPQRRHRRLAPGIHTSLPTPRAEAVVAAVAAAAAGTPPTAPLLASSFSLYWNHEKSKMAADSLASFGRRRDARGEVQRPCRDFFMGRRTRGRGRDRG